MAGILFELCFLEYSKSTPINNIIIRAARSVGVEIELLFGLGERANGSVCCLFVCLCVLEREREGE